MLRLRARRERYEGRAASTSWRGRVDARNIHWSRAAADREGSLRGRAGRGLRGGRGNAVAEQGHQLQHILIARIADEEDDRRRAEALNEERNALRAANSLHQHWIGDVVGDGRIWEEPPERSSLPNARLSWSRARMRQLLMATSTGFSFRMKERRFVQRESALR